MSRVHHFRERTCLPIINGKLKDGIHMNAHDKNHPQSHPPAHAATPPVPRGRADAQALLPLRKAFAAFQEQIASASN
jgi:hypothetical protein